MPHKESARDRREGDDRDKDVEKRDLFVWNQVEYKLLSSSCQKDTQEPWLFCVTRGTLIYRALHGAWRPVVLTTDDKRGM